MRINNFILQLTCSDTDSRCEDLRAFCTNPNRLIRNYMAEACQKV